MTIFSALASVLVLTAFLQPRIVSGGDQTQVTLILNDGEWAKSSFVGCCQAMPEFWEGFGPGTAVTYRSTGSFDGLVFESSASYHIVDRQKGTIWISVDSEGSTHEFRLEDSERTVGSVDRGFGEKSTDHPPESREVLVVGGDSLACEVYERITRSTGFVCGNGAPRDHLRRLRVWHSAETTIQRGILKVRESWESDWGKGLEEEQFEEMVITNLHATKEVDGAQWSCHEVSVRGIRGEVLYLDSTQWRTDAIPGGIVAAEQRIRNTSGDKPWRIDYYWTENITVRHLK